MRIIKFISIIILIIIMVIGLECNSFATNDIEENNPNVEDNIVNNENNTGEDNNQDNGNDENEDTNNNIDNENNSDNNIDNNVGDSNNNIDNEDNNSNITDEEGTDENPDTSEPADNPQEESPSTNNKPTINNNIVVETKSDNANLGSLFLDVEGLSPEFDKSIIDYYLIVDLSIENINVEAYPEDENAIVLSIEGNSNLQEGENTITITVRAEAGNTKTYTINVTKTSDIEMANANLKNLSVKGFSFYPSFKSNIYQYNLNINEKISQLEILPETEVEGATYEIIGNENLVEGDNLIKIIVTAKDGEAKREYKLNVFMSSKNVQVKSMDKTPAIVILIVLGISIVGVSVVLSKRK